MAKTVEELQSDVNTSFFLIGQLTARVSILEANVKEMMDYGEAS